MSRKTARKHAFQLVFETEFHDRDDLDSIFAVFFAENRISEKERQYIRQTVTGVMTHLEEIDALIGKNLARWNKDRVSKIDMAIMRVAVFEMRRSENVPMVVAINEAVELAKVYGDDESPAFVNGVLGGVAAEQKGDI